MMRVGFVLVEQNYGVDILMRKREVRLFPICDPIFVPGRKKR